MTTRHVPVLIAGAGFAGLTAALMLAWRGVPSLTVERRPDINRYPRAHGLSLRSMELFRRLPGLEADLCGASRAEPHNAMVMIAETVRGPVMRTLLQPGDLKSQTVSPAKPCSAGQDRVEPVLYRRARDLGADIRFSTELAGFEQDAGGVRATLRDVDSGKEMVCEADYLIAADGAKSAIREALGVEMRGHGTFSESVCILFRADFSRLLPTDGFLLCYVRNPDVTGAFVTTDEPNVGKLHVEFDPHRESPSDYDEARCAALVRRALGAPELDVEILEILPWKMASMLAERMTQGRVFLAGDAAHIMPPVGGLAGQAAIQDAADLAWKLAVVCQGHAGRSLLDTYEAERLPVAQVTNDRLIANYVERVRPDRESLPGKAAGADHLSVALSYRYHSEAVSHEPDDDLSLVEDVRRPTGRPGSRLPHFWLLRDGEPVSSLDLTARQGFTVLAAPGDPDWAAAARDLMQRLGVPLDVYTISSELADGNGAFLGLTGLEKGGALLVRPDGFIAWRARLAPHEPAKALLQGLNNALCVRHDL